MIKFTLLTPDGKETEPQMGDIFIYQHRTGSFQIKRGDKYLIFSSDSGGGIRTHIYRFKFVYNNDFENFLEMFSIALPKMMFRSIPNATSIAYELWK